MLRYKNGLPKKCCSTYLVYVLAGLIVLLVFKLESFTNVYGRFTNGHYSRAELSTNVSFFVGIMDIISSTTGTRDKMDKMENASKISEGNRQVVPLSAYYDMRPQHSHNNSTVILASVLEKIYQQDSIVGCEVDSITRYKPMMFVRPIYVAGWIQHVHPVTHIDITVTCFDMHIDKNSTVSLVYQVDGVKYRVPVEKKVVMPAQTAEQTGVMICSTGYGTPPNLDQWLLYQQTIGVKFIHMNVHVSFLKSVNESKVLQKLIGSGYVRMIVWEEYLHQGQVFLYSQSLKYQDCLFRYQHAYRYIMIIDFDEYFIPLGPQKKVGFYADYLFGKELVIGSIALPDIRYYCLIKSSLNASMLLDGNLTKLYDTTQYTVQGGKSLHLLKVVEEASVHEAHLIPPYKKVTYYSSSKSKCYIAHITNYPFFKKKCNS